MKCHDESKLLSYQEPDNWLCRHIKFHKPAQIISSLRLCAYKAQKGNRKAHQLKNMSLMHLSLLIYILCWVGEGEQRRRSWSLSFSQVLCVCTGPGSFVSYCLPLCPSILPVLTTKIISLHSFGCP